MYNNSNSNFKYVTVSEMDKWNNNTLECNMAWRIE